MGTNFYAIKRIKREDKDKLIEKTKELYVKSIMTDCEYMDSLNQKDESKKDWLIHNSINEPINPIWEQIMEGK